jgi:hypothetical protein
MRTLEVRIGMGVSVGHDPNIPIIRLTFDPVSVRHVDHSSINRPVLTLRQKGAFCW